MKKEIIKTNKILRLKKLAFAFFILSLPIIMLITYTTWKDHHNQFMKYISQPEATEE
jgi:ABC-type sulfate transport system permease subunit